MSESNRRSSRENIRTRGNKARYKLSTPCVLSASDPSLGARVSKRKIPWRATPYHCRPAWGRASVALGCLPGELPVSDAEGSPLFGVESPVSPHGDQGLGRATDPPPVHSHTERRRSPDTVSPPQSESLLLFRVTRTPRSGSREAGVVPRAGRDFISLFVPWNQWDSAEPLDGGDSLRRDNDYESLAVVCHSFTASLPKAGTICFDHFRQPPRDQGYRGRKPLKPRHRA